MASACNAGDAGLIPMLGRSPGEGNGKPTPVFLPAESHGQRSLTGYSPWGHKRLRHELATKQQHHVYMYVHMYVYTHFLGILQTLFIILKSK